MNSFYAVHAKTKRQIEALDWIAEAMRDCSDDDVFMDDNPDATRDGFSFDNNTLTMDAWWYVEFQYQADRLIDMGETETESHQAANAVKRTVNALLKTLKQVNEQDYDHEACLVAAGWIAA